MPDYIAKFGFDPTKYPAYLTMALARAGTPMQMLTGYSVSPMAASWFRPTSSMHRDANGNVLSKEVHYRCVAQNRSSMYEMPTRWSACLRDVGWHAQLTRAMQPRQGKTWPQDRHHNDPGMQFCGFIRR